MCSWSCLLRIDKARAKDKTYIWVSGWWKTTQLKKKNGLCAIGATPTSLLLFFSEDYHWIPTMDSAQNVCFPPSPSKSALHSRGVFACGVRATYDTDVGRVFPKHTSSLAFTFPSTEQEQSPRPPSLSDMGGRAPRSPPPRSPLPRSPPPPRARMHNPGEQSCGVGLLIKDVKDKKTGFLSFSIWTYNVRERKI